MFSTCARFASCRARLHCARGVNGGDIRRPLLFPSRAPWGASLPAPPFLLLPLFARAEGASTRVLPLASSWPTPSQFTFHYAWHASWDREGKRERGKKGSRERERARERDGERESVFCSCAVGARWPKDETAFVAKRDAFNRVFFMPWPFSGSVQASLPTRLKRTRTRRGRRHPWGAQDTEERSNEWQRRF